MIEADELRKLLDAADQPMKAMILLAINCGFGQTDVANLPSATIDQSGGWMDYPRPKTAIMRRCPLWPETVAAIREAVAKRPEAKTAADAGLVFITKYGARWVRTRERENKSAVTIDAVQLEFGKLLVALKLKRRGLGFYALRHTFRTVADRTKDKPAIDHIMGHARDDMASLYRERIEDDRLKAVVNVVRMWLWPAATEIVQREQQGHLSCALSRVNQEKPRTLQHNSGEFVASLVAPHARESARWSNRAMKTPPKNRTRRRTIACMLRVLDRIIAAAKQAEQARDELARLQREKPTSHG